MGEGWLMCFPFGEARLTTFPFTSICSNNAGASSVVGGLHRQLREACLISGVKVDTLFVSSSSWGSSRLRNSADTGGAQFLVEALDMDASCS